MIKISNNIWSIQTELTLRTVPTIYKKFNKNLGSLTDLWIIDFSNCDKIDSCGLSLVIQYIKHAKNNSIKLKLDSLSPKAISLAKVYGVKSILEQFIS